MNPDEPGSTFTVTMLSVMRADYEQWLTARGLKIARIPDPGLMHPLIVVPIAFRDDQLRPLRDTK